MLSVYLYVLKYLVYIKGHVFFCTVVDLIRFEGAALRVLRQF